MAFLLAQRNARHGWRSLSCFRIPSGAAHGLARWLALSLWAWRTLERRRIVLGAVLLAAGQRDSGGAQVGPWRPGWRSGAGAGVLAAAVIPFGVWLAAVRLWFGSTAEALAKMHLNWLPFAGFRDLADPASRVLVLLWVVGPAIVFGFLAARDLVRGLSDPRSADAWLVLGSAGLISSFRNCRGLIRWPSFVLAWA
jgi:hypothetical protein